MKTIDVWKDAVETDGRISFSLAWFKKEKIADEFSKQVEKKGSIHNGGHFHGMPLRRSPEFDYVNKEHGKLYAVKF